MMIFALVKDKTISKTTNGIQFECTIIWDLSQKKKGKYWEKKVFFGYFVIVYVVTVSLEPGLLDLLIFPTT